MKSDIMGNRKEYVVEKENQMKETAWAGDPPRRRESPKPKAERER